MFKHITVKKKLSVFIVGLFIISFATGTYFSYDRGYAHGYIQGLAEAGGTPTIDGTVGIYDMPWVNGTAANFEEFYLNSEDMTDLMTYPEQAASYVIFKDGSTIKAKNGTTGQIDYSGTDAVIIIQSVNDVLPNGGVIFFKEGVYIFSVSFNQSEGIFIQGEGLSYSGSEGTIFKLGDGADCDIININYTGTGLFGIYDIYFAGNQGNVASGSAIHVVDSRRGFIKRCAFNQVKDYAIWLEGGGYPIWIEECVFKNIIVNADNHGAIRIQSADNRVRQCSITSTKVGIYDTGENNQYYDNDIYTCGGHGMYFYSSSGNTIIGNRVHDNNDAGVAVYNSNNNILDGNQIYNNDDGVSGYGDGIRLWGTSNNNIISDNRCYDVQGTKTQPYGINLQSDTQDNIVISNNVNGNLNGGISNLGTDNKIEQNGGFITENRGTQICADNENIAHGLVGVPTMIQVTPMNDTYDGVPVITTVDWSGVGSTNIRIGLYWVNGTAISDDIILVSWYAKYIP